MEDISDKNTTLNLSTSHFVHQKMNMAFFELTREMQSTKIECMGPRENNCTSHFHSHVEIFLLLKGEQQVTIGNCTRTLKAGELAVADTFESHSYLYKAGSISTILIIPPVYLTDYFAYKNLGKLSTNFIFDKKIFDECASLVEKINTSENLLLRKGYINVLLGIIAQYCKFSPAAGHIKNEVDFVRSVLEYISANITENITQTSIAEAFNYSVSHFSKKFKATFTWFAQSIPERSAPDKIFGAQGASSRNASYDVDSGKRISKYDLLLSILLQTARLLSVQIFQNAGQFLSIYPPPGQNSETGNFRTGDKGRKNVIK